MRRRRAHFSGCGWPVAFKRAEWCWRRWLRWLCLLLWVGAALRDSEASVSEGLHSLDMPRQSQGATAHPHRTTSHDAGSFLARPPVQPPSPLSLDASSPPNHPALFGDQPLNNSPKQRVLTLYALPDPPSVRASSNGLFMRICTQSLPRAIRTACFICDPDQPRLKGLLLRLELPHPYSWWRQTECRWFEHRLGSQPNSVRSSSDANQNMVNGMDMYY
jgi:hypothetical protein